MSTEPYPFITSEPYERRPWQLSPEQVDACYDRVFAMTGIDREAYEEQWFRKNYPQLIFQVRPRKMQRRMSRA